MNKNTISIVPLNDWIKTKIKEGGYKNKSPELIQIDIISKLENEYSNILEYSNEKSFNDIDLKKVNTDIIYQLSINAAYNTVKYLNNQQCISKKAIANNTTLETATNNTLLDLLNGFYHLHDETIGSSDLIQEACVALLENIDNQNAFKLACNAVRRYVYNQSSKRTDTKHLYINSYTDNINSDGDLEYDIVNVNNEIVQLLKRIDNQSIIATITTELSPTQKKILQYVAYGYTNITISKRLGISIATVRQHTFRIRNKARELYPDYKI